MSPSILIVPSAGSLAPVGWNATADQATIFFWSVQLSICGWYQIAVPLFSAMVRGHPVSALVPGGGVAVAAGAVLGGTVAAGVLGGTVVAGGVLGGTVVGGLACEGAPAAGGVCARSRPMGVAIVAASNTAHQRDRGEKRMGSLLGHLYQTPEVILIARALVSVLPLVADREPSKSLAFLPSEDVLGKLGYSSEQDIQIEVRGERGPGRPPRRVYREDEAGPGNDRPGRACPTRHRGR